MLKPTIRLENVFYVGCSDNELDFQSKRKNTKEKGKDNKQKKSNMCEVSCGVLNKLAMYFRKKERRIYLWCR